MGRYSTLIDPRVTLAQRIYTYEILYIDVNLRTGEELGYDGGLFKASRKQKSGVAILGGRREGGGGQKSHYE